MRLKKQKKNPKKQKQTNNNNNNKRGGNLEVRQVSDREEQVGRGRGLATGQ